VNQQPSGSSTGVQAPARLTVRHRQAIEVASACRSLEELDWLGTPADAPDAPTPEAERRRYLVDLALPVGGERRTLLFRKAAFVEVGPVRRGVADCEVDLAWRSATLAPLFPVFVGRLLVNEAGLRLDGVYSPPFGGVGVLIDRAFLHLVANRTAHWLIGELATRLSTGESGVGPEAG